MRSGLLALLNCTEHSRIADIGAGTGNCLYEPARLGYFICALEPSGPMIGQGKRHENLRWIRACAERIPFKEESEETGKIIGRLSADLSNGAWERK